MTLLKKWREGLAKTSKRTFGQIANILGATEITDETWDELEAQLIQADLGLETTDAILDALEARVDREGLTRADELRAGLREELRALLEQPPALVFHEKPTIILLVGVNGSGKTTSAAKLGWRLRGDGKRVLLAAADTFRAAATEQLRTWADRLDLPVISGQPNADPGAVTFDAIKAAQSREMDFVLVDTAGRLHTRFNLMEELKKVHRVAGKAQEGAPHAVWLVMDATTGQNALQQAKAFKEAVQVTGVILAKLDSSARGGMAFAIRRELGLPILFAGLGEKPEDLEPFDPDAFLDGVLAEFG
ncbi:MAG TPA: signal recognition particle-docking protein FtsY [Anaerolineales bacterium]|nr:signal recognition particle-docking protein FtsY [Anaerolineales bacterium]